MEPPSLDQIYRAHAGEVWRWASRLLGPQGDQDDVVHDVFLVVQRRLPEWRGQAALTTWLYAITVRVAQAHRRRRRRWWRWYGNAEQNAEALPEEWAGGSADRSSDGGDPAVALERRRATEILYGVLDGIDEKHRTVFVLFELEGFPVPKIAAVLDITAHNVWIRLRRAREKFFKRLDVRMRRQP